MNRPSYFDIRDCKTLHRDWSAIGMRLMQSSIVQCIWEKIILCRIAVHICSMLQSCVLGLTRSITVSFLIESQITSQDRHSICNVNLFVDLVSMFLIDKSAIEPRLIRDCEAIEEPPNVVTGPWPYHVCLLPISSRLWLVYISVYIEISISFSVQMTLERTKSLRDCHLWVRDWFAVDRRLYLSQARLFWSTPMYGVQATLYLKFWVCCIATWHIMALV